MAATRVPTAIPPPPPPRPVSQAPQKPGASGQFDPFAASPAASPMLRSPPTPPDMRGPPVVPSRQPSLPPPPPPPPPRPLSKLPPLRSRMSTGGRPIAPPPAVPPRERRHRTASAESFHSQDDASNEDRRANSSREDIARPQRPGTPSRRRRRRRSAAGRRGGAEESNDEDDLEGDGADLEASVQEMAKKQLLKDLDVILRSYESEAEMKRSVSGGSLARSSRAAARTSGTGAPPLPGRERRGSSGETKSGNRSQRDDSGTDLRRSTAAEDSTTGTRRGDDSTTGSARQTRGGTREDSGDESVVSESLSRQSAASRRSRTSLPGASTAAGGRDGSGGRAGAEQEPRAHGFRLRDDSAVELIAPPRPKPEPEASKKGSKKKKQRTKAEAASDGSKLAGGRTHYGASQQETEEEVNPRLRVNLGLAQSSLATKPIQVVLAVRPPPPRPPSSSQTSSARPASQMQQPLGKGQGHLSRMAMSNPNGPAPDLSSRPPTGMSGEASTQETISTLKDARDLQQHAYNDFKASLAHSQLAMRDALHDEPAKRGGRRASSRTSIASRESRDPAAPREDRDGTGMDVEENRVHVKLREPRDEVDAAVAAPRKSAPDRERRASFLAAADTHEDEDGDSPPQPLRRARPKRKSALDELGGIRAQRTEDVLARLRTRKGSVLRGNLFALGALYLLLALSVAGAELFGVIVFAWSSITFFGVWGAGTAYIACAITTLVVAFLLHARIGISSKLERLDSSLLTLRISADEPPAAAAAGSSSNTGAGAGASAVRALRDNVPPRATASSDAARARYSRWRIAMVISLAVGALMSCALIILAIYGLAADTNLEGMSMSNSNMRLGPHIWKLFAGVCFLFLFGWHILVSIICRPKYALLLFMFTLHLT